MGHGDLHDAVYGDLTAYLLLARLEVCKCGHEQQTHDEDDLCRACTCDLFETDEEADDEVG